MKKEGLHDHHAVYVCMLPPPHCNFKNNRPPNQSLKKPSQVSIFVMWEQHQCHLTHNSDMRDVNRLYTPLLIR